MGTLWEFQAKKRQPVEAAFFRSDTPEYCTESFSTWPLHSRAGSGSLSPSLEIRPWRL